jgi:hypothetical protein
MKKAVLPALLCLAVSPVLHAQLATKVSAPSVNNYGKLFTDGAALYEISNDTLNSVSTATGARTMISKLPGAPGGAGTVRWASPFAVKTPTGFIIAQEVFNGGRTTYVWAGTGSSAWDTLTVVRSTYFPSEPYRLGNKYAFTIPTNGGQLLRTDGTRTGTTVVMQLPSGSQTYRSGANKLFFASSSPAGAPSTYTQRIYAVDDNSVQAIDSSSNLMLPLATIGSDLYYEYKHQVNTGGTNVSTTHSIRKWTASTSSSTTLVSGLSALSTFVTATAFNGKIIASKIDSGHHAEDLVSIDPATGTQTYLTNNPAAAFYPNYDLNVSGAGTAHLYLLADSGGKSATWVTDGATPAGTKKLYQSPTGAAFYIYQPGRFGPYQAAICGDNVYGGQYRTSGTFDMQLFSLNAAGGLSEQDINTGVIGGSDPNYFVKVGSEVLFTTQQTSSTNSPHDLYKITACASTTAVRGNELQQELVVYPNPATDQITLRVHGTARLELYDAMGRSVMAENITGGLAFSVAQLPAGLYLYRVTASSGALLHTDRLIIAH